LGRPRSEKANVVERIPWLMRIGQGILAALCILIGLLASQLFSIIGYNFAIPNLLFLGGVMFFVSVLVVSVIRRFDTQKSRIVETWGCGIHSLTSKTEYSATGFSEPIITIFSDIYRPKRISSLSYFDKSRSVVKAGSVEVTLVQFFEEFLYLPVVRLVQSVAKMVAKLENDNSNTYVLYVFLIILFVFLVLG